MDSELARSVANALSTITILSCLFLKVPQITYIRQKQSAEGIYIQAILMEIIGLSIMTMYNYTNEYSLMTYLEYPIILVQVYVLSYYVLKYKNLLMLPIVSMAAGSYMLTVAGFVLGCLPKSILSYLVPFCTPINGFAKVTYVYGIIKARNADNVSTSTWLISVTTNLARIFTVYVDSADVNLLINFFVSTGLSSAVLFTALYYQKKYPCTTEKTTTQSSSTKVHNNGSSAE